MKDCIIVLEQRRTLIIKCKKQTLGLGIFKKFIPKFSAIFSIRCFLLFPFVHICDKNQLVSKQRTIDFINKHHYLCSAVHLSDESKNENKRFVISIIYLLCNIQFSLCNHDNHFNRGFQSIIQPDQIFYQLIKMQKKKVFLFKLGLAEENFIGRSH